MLRSPESVEEKVVFYIIYFFLYPYTSRGRSSSLSYIKLKLKDYEQYKEISKYIL